MNHYSELKALFTTNRSLPDGGPRITIVLVDHYWAVFDGRHHYGKWYRKGEASKELRQAGVHLTPHSPYDNGLLPYLLTPLLAPFPHHRPMEQATMITIQDAMTCRSFYHVRLRNADGTALRCRSNGQCKLWKTRPTDFRLPVKYGLRECFYLTPDNASDWLTYDPTDREHVRLCTLAGLDTMTPPGIVADKLCDMGLREMDTSAAV